MKVRAASAGARLLFIKFFLGQLNSTTAYHANSVKLLI
jgi:hypothetical protein